MTRGVHDQQRLAGVALAEADRLLLAERAHLLVEQGGASGVRQHGREQGGERQQQCFHDRSPPGVADRFYDGRLAADPPVQAAGSAPKRNEASARYPNLSIPVNRPVARSLQSHGR